MDVWQTLITGAVGLSAGLVVIGLIRFAGSPVARPLIGVAACGALWGVGDIVNLRSADLATDQIGLAVLYSGSIFLPPLWFLLAIRWAEARGAQLPQFTERVWQVLVAWGAVMWVVVMTNPWHGQFLIPVAGDRSILLPLWWAHSIPSYSLFFFAAAVHLRTAWRLKEPPVRREAAVMLGVALLVLLSNVLSLFWLQWWPPLQGMILALAAAGVLLFAGLRVEEERRRFQETLSREVDARTHQLDEANAELRDANQRLQELQEQLLKAERLGAEEYLAGSIAHSINNPLAALKGRIEMALEARSGNDPTLERISELAHRIQEVVEGTLGLVRSRSLSLCVEVPAGVLEDVREELAERAKKHGVAIELKVAPDLPEVVVDRSLLVAALVSVAENAIDAMAETGGSLWLEAEEITTLDAPALAFRIGDSGPGIPPDLRSKVFEPFFTTKRAGTGLGLAIARGVIQGHSGSLRIEDRPDGGTLITVEIPLRLPFV
jgi:signal transduction histidine kinase